MAAPRKYPDELRERATRMAVEARRDPATRAGALARIAKQLSGLRPGVGVARTGDEACLRRRTRRFVSCSTEPGDDRCPHGGDSS